MMYYVGAAFAFHLSSVYPLALSEHLCIVSAFLLHVYLIPSIASSHSSMLSWGFSFFFHVCPSWSSYQNLTIMSIASLSHFIVQHQQKSLLVPNLISNIARGCFTLTCMHTHMLSLIEVHSPSLDAVVEVGSHSLRTGVGQAQFFICS